jgi:hypothetical protein
MSVCPSGTWRYTRFGLNNGFLVIVRSFTKSKKKIVLILYFRT